MSEQLKISDADRERQSLDVAKSKLEKILNPMFDAFAVRFMNIAEYEQMMTEERFQASEVLVFRPRRGEPKLYENFSDFLAWSKRNWYDVIRHFTDWDCSGIQALTHDALSKLLWQAHEEALQLEPNPQVIEKQTIAMFRKKLKVFLKDFTRNDKFHVRTAKQQLLWRNREYPSTMQEIRTILREAAHSSSGEDAHERGKGNDASRPYQLAMIIDPNALLANSYNSGVTKNGAEWSNLNRFDGDGNHLLGTIAIMSDREIMQSLLLCSKTGGKWAHAVFDKYGGIRFP